MGLSVPSGKIGDSRDESVIERVASRVWDSPTVMMWLSQLAKAMGLLLVMPLVLTRFPLEDITLWYLFLAIISLQSLADVGFSPTFSRLIAYGTTGAEKDQLNSFRDRTRGVGRGRTNWSTVAAICGTMSWTYLRVTVGAVLLMAPIGSAFLLKPISESSDPTSSWLAWTFLVLTSGVVLWGNQFSAYLHGLNKIALVRRWEAIMGLGAVLTSFSVMLLRPEVLWLTVAHQSWMVLNVARNWVLCGHVEEGRFSRFRRDRGPLDRAVFAAAWPSAWRAGLGSLMARAPLQFTGLLYAQIGQQSIVASYLLGLNLLGYVRNFSMAPFYTKIPSLARLRAAGDSTAQMALALRGMRLGHAVFLSGFFFLGIFGSLVVEGIGSNAPFPGWLLWSLMGSGMVIERFGAMHLQLYMTTNHVISHIADGVTGVLFLVTSAALLGSLDIYAFPVGYLVSYAVFYAPFSARRSYGLFNTSFLVMEKTVFIPASLLVIAYLLITSAIHLSK